MKIRIAIATAITTAWLAGSAGPAAWAAGPVEAGPDVDAGLNPGVPRPLWELGVGVAGLRLPDYRGSDQSRGYVLPLPYIVYRGTWLKADRDGARARCSIRSASRSTSAWPPRRPRAAETTTPTMRAKACRTCLAPSSSVRI